MPAGIPGRVAVRLAPDNSLDKLIAPPNPLPPRLRSIPITMDLPKRTRRKPQAALLGLAFDADDGQKRITRGPNFLLAGGSAETHGLLQETALKINEHLRSRRQATGRSVARRAPRHRRGDSSLGPCGPRHRPGSKYAAFCEGASPGRSPRLKRPYAPDLRSTEQEKGPPIFSTASWLIPARGACL